jgi:hypothetical protein
MFTETQYIADAIESNKECLNDLDYAISKKALGYEKMILARKRIQAEQDKLIASLTN